MSNAPAGWYPVDGASQRYWDGAAWTEHVAPLSPAPEADVSQPPAPQPQPGAQPQFGEQPQDRPQPRAGQNGPPDVPGSGFPVGIGDPHQPATEVNQQAWGAAPAGIPYTEHAAVQFSSGSGVASSADDRSMAVLCHVLGILTGFLGPLIVWLIKKDTSPFVDMHGKAALNFHLSMLIYWFVSFMAIFVVIGIFMMPVLFVLGLVFPIIAAVAANKGETHTYPMAIPFFS